jgi:hypothetical protein
MTLSRPNLKWKLCSIGAMGTSWCTMVAGSLPCVLCVPRRANKCTAMHSTCTNLAPLRVGSRVGAGLGRQSPQLL